MEERDSERNPLLNEDILENVLKYFVNQPGWKSSDIQSVRLVCKLWNYCATKTFRRNRRPLVFGPEGEPFSDLNLHINAYAARMRSFLSTMRNSQLIPVQKYCISICVLLREEGAALLNDFLQICGPDAVSLSLSIKHTEYFVNGTFNLGQLSEVNLINLKRLSLDIYAKALNIRELQELSILTGLLLDSATTLQDFSYDLLINRLATMQIVEVKKLEQNIVARIPSTVKVLTLNHLHEGNLVFQNLARRRLQLTDLTLRNNVEPTSIEDSEIIHRFLQGQTDSLQHLEIFNVSLRDDANFSLELPRLNELLSLKLEHVDISPCRVLERCPKLLRLEVGIMPQKFSPTLTNTKEPSLSLKELRLPYSYRWLGCSSSISRCFPLLNELHVCGGGHSVRTLEPVFIHFPLITHLKISFAYFEQNPCVDSILSGITEEECKRIGSLPFSELFNLDISDQLQLTPSILNLKLLRKLEIDNYAQRNAPTDISAKLFVELAALEELSMGTCKFSSTYVELLDTRLNKFQFNDNYSYESDEDDSSDEDESAPDEMSTDEDENHAEVEPEAD